ncbi:MAG: hypothetical protein LC620_08840, partial [Halobacteriales archaeon]|nr:hypothetical protein [Halobacteriales archaeon]
MDVVDVGFLQLTALLTVVGGGHAGAADVNVNLADIEIHLSATDQNLEAVGILRGRAIPKHSPRESGLHRTVAAPGNRRGGQLAQLRICLYGPPHQEKEKEEKSGVSH